MDNELYREVILDHYQHPRNSGKPKIYTHTAKKDNPFCGDQIEFYLSVANGIVEDINFVAHGCAISIASASILSTMIKGWKVEKVKKLMTKDILEMLTVELTPTRLKCALLPLEAVQYSLQL